MIQDPLANTMHINASNASLKKLLQKSASKAVLRSNVDNYHLGHFNPSLNKNSNLISGNEESSSTNIILSSDSRTNKNK